MLDKLRTFFRRRPVQLGLRAAQTLLLAGALLLGCFWLARCVDQFYPVKTWLIWRYVGYWAGALLFTVTCQVAGTPIVERLGQSFRVSERLLLAQTVGVVVFFLGMFGLGLVHLYRPATFFLLPLILLAAGAKTTLRVAKRLWRLRRQLYARPRAPLGALHLCAIGLGLVSLLLLYSQILHPLNASYDARWYHLSLAEQYAAEGRLLRYPDGSYVNANPHLASFLYTWAFLAPTTLLFDKVELCAHMVFVMFCFILVGVAQLTRRLLAKRSAGAWSVMFLFPGFFLYDSGLHLGADHPAAFFAAPLAICCFVTGSAWQTRNWLLLGTMVAGATLTKYSVAALFVVPGLVLGLRGVWGLVRQPRAAASWLLPPLWGGLAALVLTAPHWAKNWLFYGNPVFPYAASLFKHAPWGDYNRRIFETWSNMHEWSPHGTLGQRFDETIHAVPFFAFQPHDWPAFHGTVPVFGFLFSLSGLALPFVSGKTRRIWLAFIATYVGIFLWYWGMHQDRYLQVLLPWMAAATAATLTLAWRTSWWTKLPLAALVVLQLAWGSDVPFIPGHTMLGRPPTAAAIDFASTGYRHQVTGRLTVFEPYQSIGKLLVPGVSRVLLHENHIGLGLGTMVLQDYAHTQGYIDYGSQTSLGGVYRMLKGMGVTDITWIPHTSAGWSGYAGDLIFFDFLRSHTGGLKSVMGWQLAALRDGPDLDLREAKVAYLGCQGGFSRGLYPLSRMNFPDIVVTDPKAFPQPELPFTGTNAESLVKAARYAVTDPICGVASPVALAQGFTMLANRSSVQLWSRDGQALRDSASAQP